MNRHGFIGVRFFTEAGRHFPLTKFIAAPILKFMRIPCRFRYPLQSLLISLSMSSVLSLVFTLVHGPAGQDFLPAWLESFAIGIAVGFPVSRLVVPRIIRLCERLSQSSEREDL